MVGAVEEEEEEEALRGGVTSQQEARPPLVPDTPNWGRLPSAPPPANSSFLPLPLSQQSRHREPWLAGQVGAGGRGGREGDHLVSLLISSEALRTKSVRWRRLKRGYCYHPPDQGPLLSQG